LTLAKETSLQEELT
jgi:chromosome segregation ATPase